MSGERIHIRWDDEMGCYRVNVPEWKGGEVVLAEAHDAEVARLRDALNRIYQFGRGPHVRIAAEALDA